MRGDSMLLLFIFQHLSLADARAGRCLYRRTLGDAGQRLTRRAKDLGDVPDPCNAGRRAVAPSDAGGAGWLPAATINRPISSTPCPRSPARQAGGEPFSTSAAPSDRPPHRTTGHFAL